MRRKLDILKWLLPLVVLLATACGHDDIVLPDEYLEELPTPYVEVRIAVPLANPSATRANPVGGEEGNGREQGIINEDIVHDINIFFYKDEHGLDGSSETTIDYHIFFNIDNMLDEENSQLLDGSEPIFDKHYLSLKFELEGKLAELGVGTHFATVANIGNIQDSKVKNLRDLRNLNVADFSGTWSTTVDAFSSNASNMDYFLMSTAYNTNYKGTGSNTITEYSPGQYTGTTTLERMYSRIDLWYNKGKNAITEGTGDDAKVTELKYCIVDSDGEEVTKEIKDADGNTIRDDKGNILKESVANVYLTNVLPVNVMKNPSYLFKKVTQNLNSWDKSNLANQSDALINWAGTENVNGNGMPVNYVLERHTTDKQVGGNTSMATLKDWYGKTAAEYVSGKSKFKSDAAASEEDCSIKNTDIGKFQNYYHGTPASSSDPAYGCNHISIISYANENTHPTDCFHSNYLTGMAFRAVYVPDKIYSGSHETTGADGKTEVVATEWQATDGTPTKIYRYSPSGRDQKESLSLYFTDRDEAVKYSAAHPGDNATISTDAEAFTAIEHVVGKDADGNDIKKWGFVCYYNVWLRHYNNEAADPQTTYPMEYATVRNNIYRLAVTFSGPGDPTPTMREPDTMKARIFVRKWNYKEEPTITF